MVRGASAEDYDKYSCSYAAGEDHVDAQECDHQECDHSQKFGDILCVKSVHGKQIIYPAPESFELSFVGFSQEGEVKNDADNDGCDHQTYDPI